LGRSRKLRGDAKRQKPCTHGALWWRSAGAARPESRKVLGHQLPGRPLSSSLIFASVNQHYWSSLASASCAFFYLLDLGQRIGASDVSVVHNLDPKQVGYYQPQLRQNYARCFDPDLLQKMKRSVQSLSFFLRVIRDSPTGFITNADMRTENCVQVGRLQIFIALAFLLVHCILDK
jgi:hypothetical protein